MNKSILVALCLSGSLSVCGQVKHSAGSLHPSYKGLVMAGYQGWFNTPGDGAERGWTHYQHKGNMAPGNCHFDVWPDVSEYKHTYPTPFTFADGSTARLFSSYDKSTVDLHFKWMEDYGIDGVFVQRFVTNLRGEKSLRHNTTMLNNALHAAGKHKRAISIMYDLSGMKETDADLVIEDWKRLVDSLGMTTGGKKQAYLYHHNKPLVALWGVGFPGRAYTTQTVEKMMNFLQNDPVYGGCSILLGVPTYWRDQGADATKDTAAFFKLVRRADIIHPWFVGRFNETSYADKSFPKRIADDIAWCKANGLDYVPVIFPGFSWANMNPGSRFDQIPRNRGNFFWKQVTGAIGAGAEMIYVAMFDEIDEGTAIFKAAKQPPAGPSKFITFEEGIPSDYYLYLAGMAGKMLRKEIPLQQTVPAPLSAATGKK
jgi:hypothetical protein